MNLVDSSLLGVPLLSVLAALCVSLFLRISLWKAVLIAIVPLLALSFEFPLAPEYLQNPLYRLGIGWGALTPLLFGFRLGRIIVNPIRAGTRIFRIIISTSVWLATLLALALYFSPQYIDQIIPTWRGSLGLLLLVSALFAFAFSLIRSFRSFALASLLLFVSLTLAAEIFLQKLPTEIFSDEFLAMSDFSSKQVDSAGELAHEATDWEALRVGVLLQDGENTLQDTMVELRRLVADTYPALKLQLRSLAKPQESVKGISSRLRGTFSEFKPDILFISGGRAEGSSPDAHGMSDSELETYSKFIERVSKIPGGAKIASARLTHFIGLTAIRGRRSIQRVETRVSLPEFENELSALIALASSANSQIVLFEDPFLALSSKDPYIKQAQQVAENAGVPFLGFRARFLEDDLYEHRLDPQTLSKRGIFILAQGLFSEIERIEKDSSIKLASLIRSRRAIGQTEHTVLVLKDDQNRTLHSKITALSGEPADLRLQLRINGEDVESRRLKGAQIESKFDIPDTFRDLPATEISLFVKGKNNEIVRSEAQISFVPFKKG